MTNCKAPAEYDNQSMIYEFTTGNYSGSFSWGVQANSYNTPDILEDDRTRTLPLQTHWQGSFFTYRQTVNIPNFPGP